VCLRETARSSGECFRNLRARASEMSPDSNEYLSSAFWRVSSAVAGYEERRKRKLDLHQKLLQRLAIA